jgi:hypothetical protein
MASENYKRHLLVSTASLDSKTEQWTTAPYASWGNGANRKFHRINDLPYQFDTRQDAEEFGILILKSWVDFEIEV